MVEIAMWKYKARISRCLLDPFAESSGTFLKYMNKEIWRDIPGWEGLYQVSTYGNVASLNYNHTGMRRLRIPRVGKGGYLYLDLHKNGVTKTMKIHRLVAITFIPNPNNLPQINHKDENKLNNNVENLEWCDASYNNRYGSRPRKVLDAYKRNGSSKAERPVVKIDNYGTIIEEYISISDAARKNGVRRETLRDCVLGRQHTCCGYVWRYKQ